MQGIKVSFKIKHILISSILGLMVSLCLASFAFADDSVQDLELPDSALLAPVTGEDRDYDLLLRQTASVLAAQSDINVEDIYNILIMMSYYSGGARYVRTDDINSDNIYTWLTTYMSNSGGLIDDIYDIKLFLYDMLESQTGDNFIQGIYYNMELLYNRNHSDISSVINLITSCNTKLDTLDGSVSLLGSKLDTISTKQTNLYNLVNSGLSNISTKQTNLYNLVNTQLTNIQSDMNNVNWSDISNINASFYLTLNDAKSLTNPVTQAANVTEIYARVKYQDGLNYIHLPISAAYVTPSIEFYTNSGGSVTLNSKFILNTNRYYIDLYFNQPLSVNSGSTYYIFKISGQLTLRNTIETVGKYLTVGSEDYYKVSNWINTSHIDDDLHYQKSILDRFKELYASDDLVAAKQAQQGYEDQAISDFTGSGSAAAKGSDLTSAKQISGSVKSGLNSGGSVNNGLSGFSTSGGLYSWFTQENYNYINNLYVPNQRNLKSSSDDYDMSTYEDNYQYILDNLGDDQR